MFSHLHQSEERFIQHRHQQAIDDETLKYVFTFVNYIAHDPVVG